MLGSHWEFLVRIDFLTKEQNFQFMSIIQSLLGDIRRQRCVMALCLSFIHNKQDGAFLYWHTRYRRLCSDLASMILFILI